MGEIAGLVADVLGHVATSEYERWRKKSRNSGEVVANFCTQSPTYSLSVQSAITILELSVVLVKGS